MDTHTTAPVWKSEDSLWELVLFFNHVNPGIKLLTTDHLAGPYYGLLIKETSLYLSSLKFANWVINASLCSFSVCPIH